jgi:hypothetical protein
MDYKTMELLTLVEEMKIYVYCTILSRKRSLDKWWTEQISELTIKKQGKDYGVRMTLDMSE